MGSKYTDVAGYCILIVGHVSPTILSEKHELNMDLKKMMLLMEKYEDLPLFIM